MKKQEIDFNRLMYSIERVARKAGDYALKMQSSAKKTVQKIEGDFATDIDFECEELIKKELSQIQPLFPVFTEEEYKRPEADIYWVVDPLDGTKNYYPGLPLWSVNIALYDAKNKNILLGVVYLPKLGDLFKAYKGGGAYLNGEKIKPSNVTDPAEAKIYVELPNKTTGFIGEEEFQKLRKEFYRIRTWGLGSALCYVASGAFDAFFDFCGTTRDYDIFASMIIAKEAGCEVLQFDPAEKAETRIIKVVNGKLKFS